MKNILIAILSYLIGTINPSYIIAKMKGFDIRKKGSKNAGGSNALITMGNKIGVFCMVFDILKAFLVVKIAYHFKLSPIMIAVVIDMVILGHMFPFYMNFKGGKGLACLGGCVLAYDWKLFLIMLLAELVLAYLVDYICFASTTASIAFTIIYSVRNSCIYCALILSVVCFATFYKHIVNIKRVINGTEARFSFLWHKGDELERIKKVNEDA